MSIWAMISTAGSTGEAQKIAKALVGEGLAACVTLISGAISYFYWEGKLTREKETVILVKTVKRNAGKIIKKMKEIHSYEVPEVLFFHAAGGEKRFMSWVENNARRRNKKILT